MICCQIPKLKSKHSYEEPQYPSWKIIRKQISTITYCITLGTGFSSLSAQTNAASDQITAQPAADRIVPFRLSEQGVVRPVEWGLDTAWEDEEISAVARDLWKR